MPNILNLMLSKYYQDHKDLGIRECPEKLGIEYNTLF